MDDVIHLIIIKAFYIWCGSCCFCCCTHNSQQNFSNFRGKLSQQGYVRIKSKSAATFLRIHSSISELKKELCKKSIHKSLIHMEFCIVWYCCKWYYIFLTCNQNSTKVMKKKRFLTQVWRLTKFVSNNNPFAAIKCFRAMVRIYVYYITNISWIVYKLY